MKRSKSGSEMVTKLPWLDTFFEDVTVNAADPNLRLNRLRLLARIGEAMGQVADFAQIEG